MTPRAPEWLIAAVRQSKRGDKVENANSTRKLLAGLKLNTVCESAKCPNQGGCFSRGTATFLILGNICTRACAFCAMKKGPAPPTPDPIEPATVARAVNALGLSYAVITSVTRDDLPDGGADHYARTLHELRKQCPGIKVEFLIPDFGGSDKALARLLGKDQPDVLAHNLETVPRLYHRMRKGALYCRSCALLKKAKMLAPDLVTKSSLMLGLGETEEEIEQVLQDLHQAGCDILTLGQYLSPSLAHAPVLEYVPPQKFASWRKQALDMGFKGVAAGPLIRSSYDAGALFHSLRGAE